LRRNKTPTSNNVLSIPENDMRCLYIEHR